MPPPSNFTANSRPTRTLSVCLRGSWPPTPWSSPLVLACAQLAYNILRFIGQNGLFGPEAPRRHRAKRRLFRTVLPELMYLAARLVYTGRQIKLAFGFGCPVVPIFRRLYAQLVGTGCRSWPWPHYSRLVAVASLRLLSAVVHATTFPNPIGPPFLAPRSVSNPILCHTGSFASLK